jgi:hypothetical protein
MEAVFPTVLGKVVGRILQLYHLQYAPNNLVDL